MTNIAFIGGGNMARALIGGLLTSGSDANSFWVSDPNAESLAAVREMGVKHTTHDNGEAVAAADVVVLAVKPQYLQNVAEGLRAAVASQQPLVVSIAAGKRLAQLVEWLGGHRRIVRVMPNTPSLIGRGMAGLYAPTDVSDTDRATASTLVAAVGGLVWVERESGIDAVTAISGSGPAYFFYVMEHLEAAARALGLDAQTAHRLTCETAAGAAEMALRSDVDLAELRRRVTSPGGTTEAALNELAAHGVDRALGAAANAARARSIELSKVQD